MSIKPIETRYHGYRFRSRLEARWAVWLDHMGVEYTYEAQGYDLGNGEWYLPDFWLFTQECYMEIKPRGNPPKDMKCAALAAGGYDVVLVVGDPWPGDYLAIAYVHDGEVWGDQRNPLKFAVGRKQDDELWLVSEGLCEIQLNSVGGKEKGSTAESDRLKIAYQMARGARF